MGFNNHQPIEEGEEEAEEELTILDSQHVCDSIHVSTVEFSTKAVAFLWIHHSHLSSPAAAALRLMLMVFDVSAATGQEASGSSDRPAEPQTTENQPGVE